MNLLNLRTLGWDGEIAAFTAPGAAGQAAPGGSVRNDCRRAVGLL